MGSLISKIKESKMEHLSELLVIFFIIHRKYCSMICLLKDSLFSDRSIVFIFVLVFAIILGPSLVSALSLQEAREEALRNNLNIRISKEMILEKQSESKEQFTAMLPKFTLESYGSHSDEKAAIVVEKGEIGTFFSYPFPESDVEVETGKRDNLLIGLKLEQPVFIGGKLYYSYQMAKAREEWSEWNDQQVILDIILKVEEAYFNVLKAKENKKFADKHQTTLNAHLADVEMKYQKGRVAFHEVLKVKLEVTRSKELVTSADNALSVSKTWLNTVLNRPINQSIEVTKVEEPMPLSITIEEAEKQAFSYHPSLKRARAKRNEALYNRKISEADYYPNIVFTAEYYQRTEQPVYPEENWYVMLNMKWPFWEWGRTKHKIEAARSLERQSEHFLSDLENQIKAKIRQAWLHIKEADVQIEVSKEAMNYAEENLRITQLGFEKGINTSTDVLVAEELLMKTQSDYINAKYDARYARAILRNTIGTTDFEDPL